MKKEWLPLFYALVYLSFTIKDRYLISKLKHKINQLWLTASVVYSSPSPILAKLRYRLADAEEWVDLLIHLRVVPLSPALQAKKHLLEMRLKLFDGDPKPHVLEKKGEPSTVSQDKPKPLVPKSYDLSVKILELVKECGSCQTREIVRAFKNDFAPRTIQRYIQQLANAGRLKKEQAGIRNVYTLAESAPKI